MQPRTTGTTTDYRLTVDFTHHRQTSCSTSRASEAYRAGAYGYNIGPAQLERRRADSGDRRGGLVARRRSAAGKRAERRDRLPYRVARRPAACEPHVLRHGRTRIGRRPIGSPMPTSPDGFPHRQLVNTGDVRSGRRRARRPDRRHRQLHARLFRGQRRTHECRDRCANNGDVPVPRDRSRTAIRSAADGRSRFRRRRNLTFGLNYAYTGQQQTHPGGTDDHVLPTRVRLHSVRLVLRLALRAARTTDSGNARVRYTNASDGSWAVTLLREQPDRRGLRQLREPLRWRLLGSTAPPPRLRRRTACAPQRSALGHHARPPARGRRDVPVQFWGGWRRVQVRDPERSCERKGRGESPGLFLGGHGWPTCRNAGAFFG